MVHRCPKHITGIPKLLLNCILHAENQQLLLYRELGSGAETEHLTKSCVRLLFPSAGFSSMLLLLRHLWVAMQRLEYKTKVYIPFFLNTVPLHAGTQAHDLELN